LYGDKKSLTCNAITIPDVSMVLKSPMVTWQNTHSEFMKLIIRTNVLCLNLDIHKSKEVVVVTHESKMGITYCSMILATNEMMAC
jgi:hypothetical protein